MFVNQSKISSPRIIKTQNFYTQQNQLTPTTKKDEKQILPRSPTPRHLPAILGGDRYRLYDAATPVEGYSASQSRKRARDMPPATGYLVLLTGALLATADAAVQLPDTSGIDGQLTANLGVDHFFSLWLVFSDDDVKMSGKSMD